MNSETESSVWYLCSKEDLFLYSLVSQRKPPKPEEKTYPQKTHSARAGDIRKCCLKLTCKGAQGLLNVSAVSKAS